MKTPAESPSGGWLNKLVCSRVHSGAEFRKGTRPEPDAKPLVAPVVARTRARVRTFFPPDALGQVQTEDGFIGRVVGRSAGGRFEVKIPGINETRTLADAELMEPMPIDEMARILEDVGVLGFSAEAQKKRSGKNKPIHYTRCAIYYCWLKKYWCSS